MTTFLGFGRSKNGEFKIIVEQPFIDGQPVSDEEIADYMSHMGFELKNPRNWTMLLLTFTSATCMMRM